jgi:hypothetical protein
VVEIGSETRIDLLRQVALLQQQEIERLHARIVELVGELAQVRGEDASAALQQELVHLQEQLSAARHKFFERSSVRRVDSAPAPAGSGLTPGTPGSTLQSARPGHGPALPHIDVAHPRASGSGR